MGAVISKKKKVRIEKEAVQIPEDVAVGILMKLPVKSLLRFRCACKTWYSVISDPEFCDKFHQKRAHVLICRRPKTRCPVHPEHCNKFHQNLACCRRPSTFSTVTVEEEESLVMNEKPLPLPWKPERGSRTKFLGSCNGLVCVHHTSPRPGRSGLILWNPSTRKYRKLPSAPRVRNLFDESTYAGFGYDESAGDYKFVWMVIKPYPFPQRRTIEFDVFSLKSNTWSSFDHCQPSDIILSGTCILCEHRGVLFNGAIHWIVCDQDNPSKCGNRICAFDLASRTYRLLQFPQECRGWDSKLVSLSGCFCCLYTRHPVAGVSSIDLWMMKEYGVVSSWRKLALLPTTFSIPRAISLSTYPSIHFSSEEGNIVALAEHQKGYEIMRFQVEEGAIVSYETLLSVSWNDGIIVFEETLVSLY